MKKIFYLFLAFIISQNLVAQTKTWVGGNAGGVTNWNIAANWSPSGVPTNTDDVVINIGTNDPIISSGVNAVAKSVSLTVLNSGLTVNSGASLTVSSSAGSTISVALGTLTNNGTLSSTNTSSVLNLGVDEAISLINTGKVNNSGTMTLNGGVNVGIFVSTGNFTNLSGGNVTSNGSYVLRMGSANSGFTNSSGATLTGTGTANSFFIETGTFNNGGTANVTGQAELYYDGTNVTSFTNASTGILNVTGDFYNRAGVTLTNPGQLTVSGNFVNSGFLNNTSCGKIKVMGNFSNGTTNNSIISTNSGLTEIGGNLTNNLTGTYVNNGVLIANSYPSYSNRRVQINTNQASNTGIFTISTTAGASTINGIFKDAAATISAGTYVQGTNTFTPTVTNSGATTLYAKTTHGSCVNIVPFVFILPPTRRYAKTVASGTADGSTWANAGTLQNMIIASRNIDSVWVASGLYKPLADATGEINPTDARQKVFYMKSGVKIFGGFGGDETILSARDFKTNKTILSGDIDNNDTNGDGNNIAEVSTNIQGNNAYQILIIASCDKTTMVDGFIFTAAKSNNTTTPAQTVNGLSITPDLGSAINITSSFPTIQNCVFSGNYGGFFGNVYQNNLTSPYVDTVKVISAIFTGNYAQYGGGMFIRRGHHYSNNLVMYNNTSDYGGALIVQNNMSASGTVDFVNATFVNNYSTFGKSLKVDAGTVKLVNSIVYNAVPYSGGNISSSGGTLASRYSLLQNSATSGTWNSNYGTDGGNNFDANPMFTNTADIDGIDNKFFTSDDGLSLMNYAPAINRGTNTGVLSNDITLNPRPYSGGLTDIGAYEYQGGSPSAKNNVTLATGNWDTITNWTMGRLPISGETAVINQNHFITLIGTGNAKDVQFIGSGKLIYNTNTSNLNVGF
jgi:hypothetical protein